MHGAIGNRLAVNERPATTERDSSTSEKYRFKAATRPSGANGFARTILSAPAVRTLLAFLLICYLANRHGRNNFYRDPGSVFFDEARAYERSYSRYREQEASTFMTAAVHDAGAHSGKTYPKAGSNPQVCASFITVRRNMDVQYLSNAIGSFVEGLSLVERTDVNLKVLFAHTDPKVHPDWTQPWVRALVDEAYSYKETVLDKEFARLQEWTTDNRLAEKALLDYSLALEHCLDNTTAPFVAIFEDDILFAQGWFTQSLKGLVDVQATMTAQKRAEDWLFLRLFNQERSTGWASKELGANNEAVIALGISSVLFALLLLIRRRSYSWRHNLDNWTLAVICLLVVPATVIFFFKAGKASLLPPSPGVREEPFGCCGQGLVYPRERLPGLIKFLRQHQIGQFDMISQDYARGHDLARFALHPAQLQHVGLISARNTTEKEAQAVWSMAFEDLHPTNLAAQHKSLLHEIYGPDASDDLIQALQS